MNFCALCNQTEITHYMVSISMWLCSDCTEYWQMYGDNELLKVPYEVKFRRWMPFSVWMPYENYESNTLENYNDVFYEETSEIINDVFY